MHIDGGSEPIKMGCCEHTPTPKAKEAQRLSFSIEAKFIFSLIWSIPLLLHMFLSWHWLHNTWVQLVLCIPVYLLGVFHFGKSALKSLRNKEPNMDVLIFIGTSAAFFYSLSGTLLSLGADFLFYETTSTIISLVLLGNVLEHRSLKQTTSSIEDLNKLQAQTAKRVSSSNEIEECDISDLKVGDLVLINTGDTVPADSIINVGSGSFDESMLTGESIPVEKGLGDTIIGGTILTQGTIKAEVSKAQKDSTLTAIIKLVESALSTKPSIQKLGDKVSAVFVPVVLLISLLTFLVSAYYFGLETQTALLNAVAVLVIACPCAMGLATPTAVVVAIGKIAQQGVLIRGGKSIEELAQIDTLIFDKTGTLTTGNFKVDKIETYTDQSDLKAIIKSLEQYSSHPIARSLYNEFKAEQTLELEEVSEEKGVGISAIFNGARYEIRSSESARFDLALIKESKTVAEIKITDELRAEAKDVITYLKSINIKTVLLSGDKQEKCSLVAEKLGIDSVFAEQTPEQKLKVISELQTNSNVGFVGDGINDAPALAQASVGISLSDATDVAIQSSQIVLLNNNLAGVVSAIKIAKRCFRTIKQNLFWAFFYNVCAIPVAAIGLLNPMVAALTMAFSDVIVIGNSLRLKLLKT